MALKFRTRLLLINLSAICVVSVIMLAGAYSIISHQMQEETMGFLKDEFQEYSLKYEAMLDRIDAVSEDMHRHFTQARMTYPIVCRVYDTAGRAVVDVENFQDMPKPDRRFVLQALTDDEIFCKIRSPRDGRPYWFLLRSIQGPTKERYVFELGLNVRRMEMRILRLRNNMLLLVAAVMVLALAIAWICTRQALSPIEHLNSTLHRIRSSSLDQRLPVRGTDDEIDSLAREVNLMLVEIEDSFSHIRDFTADAAHELRTPLTHLMLLLEKNVNRSLAPQEAQEIFDRAYEHCYRLQRMIEDLMLLARLDTGQMEDEPVPCGVDEILLNLEELWRTLTEEMGIALEMDVEPGLRLRGRPVLLRRLFINLFDNAIRYTPKEGIVSVQARRSGSQYSVTVSNTGPGIPESELSKIFQRFYRVDPSRSRQTGGMGLGLDICQKICRLHQGQIRVESIEGQITRFVVLLPPNGDAETERSREKNGQPKSGFAVPKTFTL